MTQPALERIGPLWPLFYSVRVAGSPAQLVAASPLQPFEHPRLYRWFNCSARKTSGDSITAYSLAAKSLNERHLERQVQYAHSLLTLFPLEIWQFLWQEWFSK